MDKSHYIINYNKDYVIPDPLDSRVVPAVRNADVKADQLTGAASIEILKSPALSQ
ncbi:hypothetical protein [Cytobacillus oceanisediminis]|jgi:malate dehydrogenase (oxaloacetate-decarboxylating)|uniref:hypothetical protein n=1 Tax=Cytobacillus oceanisediminis TaxID=665099 RepID=UPI00215A2449|nr:hypothetical protein [Cytobacillus oceanisediminis]